MLIYSWNVRGLNSSLKQHEVANLMRRNRMDICGLLETKLNSSFFVAEIQVEELEVFI
jgi:exonuclease III